MRKFNLRGNVARRLMGVEKAPAAAPEEKTVSKARDSQEPRLRIAWRTDTGKVRRTNQDTVILGNGLAGIADGMGGHQGGEVASAGMRDGLLRETEGKTPDEKELERAISAVNLELWNRQEADSSLTGMGTTLTVLWPAPDQMLIAQVGDSRAYLLRDGTLEQVTQDHSMVADMVRRGVLTEEQAANHPMRNYITRAIGTEDTIDVDITTKPRRRDDRWLVCSDGLHGLVPRAELERMMRMDNPEEAANALLEAALENGGRDNISLVILVDEEGGKESAAPKEEPAKEAVA